MKISRYIVGGQFMTNCYAVDDENGCIAVIDPGSDAEKIRELAEKDGGKITHILITHGHSDHVGGVSELRDLTGAETVASQGDLYRLHFDVDRVVSEGDVIKAGDLEFTVIETPGHTEGGICFLCGDYLFTGDTLFRNSIGRTDLGGGDIAVLMKSLKKLMDLPYDDLTVCPGHMGITSLQYERENNPFLSR